MLAALLLLSFADGNFPPVEQIVEKGVAARKAQDAKGIRFTFREDEERRDEKGHPLKPFVKTFDVIMLEGENYRKLILQDGMPLDAKTAKKVEADLEKARDERKKHKLFHQGVPGGRPDDLRRLFLSKVTGEETVNGRKAWRVESEPRSDVQPANPQDEAMLASRRVTWFDAEEGIAVRQRTEYFRKVQAIQPGTHIEIEWSKVGEAWMPATLAFRASAHFMPGINAFGDTRTRFYDYKRFTAESTFTPN